MIDYNELGEWLGRRGIGSYLRNDNQLVLSPHYPALPSANTFWVTKTGDKWYLSTWLPAMYLVPPDQDLRAVCESVFRSSATAIYTIAPDLAERLGLRRLSEAEMEQVRLAM